MGFIHWFRLAINQRKYVYGEIVYPDGTHRCRARRVVKTGQVEFVLWKAGEQGHDTDYWHVMGFGWESWFRPESES